MSPNTSLIPEYESTALTRLHFIYILIFLASLCCVVHLVQSTQVRCLIEVVRKLDVSVITLHSTHGFFRRLCAPSPCFPIAHCDCSRCFFSPTPIAPHPHVRPQAN